MEEKLIAVNPERRVHPNPAGTSPLTLRLPHRLPLARAELLQFLERRAVPGIEAVIEGRYRRTVALGPPAGIIDLDLGRESEHVVLRLQLDHLQDLNPAIQRCRRLLDLDADPLAIERVLMADPGLEPLVQRWPGLRVPGAVDGWEIAVRAILGQQVSVAAARTTAGRLVAALGTPLAEPDGRLTHLFPPPEALVQSDGQALGITRQKTRSIQALARAILHNGLVLDRGVDREETVRHLLALPGIGAWTASYVAMRALGDPDAFLATDLGILQACRRLGLGDSPRDIERRAERWRPWRAYAAIYLWQGLVL